MSEGVVIAKSYAKKQPGETTDDVNMRTRSNFFSIIKSKPVNSTCIFNRKQMKQIELKPLALEIRSYRLWGKIGVSVLNILKDWFQSHSTTIYVGYSFSLGGNCVQDTPKQTRSNLKDYFS